MGLARKWKRRKEREAGARDLDLAGEFERLEEAFESMRYGDASRQAASLETACRERGKTPPPEVRASLRTIHHVAFDVGGPSSPDGLAAIQRWEAGGGDPITPVVARLSEAWRAGTLDPALVPESLPEPARELLRFMCRALGSDPARTDPTRFRAEVKRRFGAAFPHLPDLFRAWAVDRRGGRPNLPAALRKKLDEVPVAATLAYLVADKRRLLSEIWLDEVDDGGFRQRFLLAAAKELAAVGDEESELEIHANPVGGQYPPIELDESRELAAIGLDFAVEAIGCVLDDPPRPEVLGAAVRLLSRAIEAGRHDVVHELAEVLIDSETLEGSLRADIERVRAASARAVGCGRCVVLAHEELLDRLVAAGDEARRDRQALCQLILEAGAEVWPPTIRARALEVAAADGSRTDPDLAREIAEDLLREGEAMGESFAELLDGSTRRRLQLDAAIRSGERTACLAAIHRWGREDGARGLATALAFVLASTTRQIPASIRSAFGPGLGACGPVLSEADVAALVETVGREAGALDLAEALDLLARIRRAFGQGRLLDRTRALLSPRVDSLLAAAAREAPGDDFGTACRLASGGVLCGREESILEGTRRIRRFVAGAADPCETARRSWMAILALESLRDAYPAVSARVDGWQRSFLRALVDLEEAILWEPLLAPDEGIGPEALAVVRGVLSRFALELPQGPEPAILCARGYIERGDDLAKAREWLAEARRRKKKRRGRGRALLDARIADCEAALGSLEFLEEVGENEIDLARLLESLTGGLSR